MLMSAVFLQEGSHQHRLENKFARFMGSEAGILAQSGLAANVGLMQCIAGPGIPVYLDMQAHASLWEGVLSAQAQPVAFLHNDWRTCSGSWKSMAAASSSSMPYTVPTAAWRRCWTGGYRRAQRLHAGRRRVAFAGHAWPAGRGPGGELGLAGRVHFRTASLAKAFAGRAGLITCSARFKGYFLSASRPAIFSSCLLEHELAWFDAALDFIRAADAPPRRLAPPQRAVAPGPGELGYNVSDGTEQIIALEAGSEPATLILRKALERHGIYGAMFCAPATPKNRSLVRLTLNAGLREDESPECWPPAPPSATKRAWRAGRRRGVCASWRWCRERASAVAGLLAGDAGQ